MPQAPTTHSVSPLRLVREARSALLEAARSQSWLKRSEAITKADRHLAKVEPLLRPKST